MGVLQRLPCRLAVIFEKQHVLEAYVAPQVVYAVPISPEQVLDALVGHRGERLSMLRCFDDDLVSADAIHLVVHAFRLAADRTFDTQDRKLIGYDPKSPTWLVGS